MQHPTAKKANHALEKILDLWERTKGRIKNDQDVRDFNRSATRNGHPLMFRGIGIHGGGWEATNGCIGMTNADVKTLYDRLSSSSHGVVGVRVEIRSR
ncbi:L,D-transpeptidase [Myxococcota bacterium]|nr:L,D-transpeptidase [Myxococcota bacterium]